MDINIIEACLCDNTGFIIFDNEYIQCARCFAGQLSPAVKRLLANDQQELFEMERKSKLSFQIKKSKNRIKELKQQFEEESIFLSVLQGFSNETVDKFDLIPETQRIIEGSEENNYRILIDKNGFLF